MKHDLTPENVTGMRRSSMRIIADILRQTKKPAKKTHIMYECNLSFYQLKQYLNLLRRRALIHRKIDTGAIIYQTTKKGHEFLRRYSNIARLLQPSSLKHS